MNLENLNVVELDTKEARAVQGGIIPWLIGMAVVIVVKSVYDAWNGNQQEGQPHSGPNPS